MKEPACILRSDGKRPVRESQIPWVKVKLMPWDVTVPDTFAEFSLSSTAAEQGAAAKQAADNKTAKYQGLDKTHVFSPDAIETAETWNKQAIELVQGILRHTSVITEDSRETTFLFQRLSVALQRGKCVLILRHFPARLVSRCSHLTFDNF